MFSTLFCYPTLTDGHTVKLIRANGLKKLMISYLGGNKYLESLYLDGKIALEMVPQGTLVERIRAHGAVSTIFSLRFYVVKLCISGNPRLLYPHRSLH